MTRAGARLVRTGLRVVLLDFGGTLDSEGLHWSTQLALAFAAAGAGLARTELDRAFLAADRELEELPGVEALDLTGHVGEQARRMAAHLSLAPAVGERAAAAFLARARPHLERSHALLAGLRGPLRFGLVSNFTPNLQRILEETGLAAVLDAVVCSARCGLRKPDPAIFRLALSELEARPEEAAMIGDSLPSDIVPAKEVGLATVWLRGDQVFGRGDERAADAVVSDLASGLARCAGDHAVAAAEGSVERGGGR